MIILKGKLMDDVPDYYINKAGNRVDYRDIQIKVGAMKYEKVRVPFDYKLNIDKDGNVTFSDDEKFEFGSTARKYNSVTKQFEYTPISYYISTRKTN